MSRLYAIKYAQQHQSTHEMTVVQSLGRVGRLRACSPSAFSKRSYSTHSDRYDVVCVGGGPAGLGLLTALKSFPATSSLKLALVESQDLSRAASWTLPPDAFSNRASSLTPASRRFLEQIGAWQHLDVSRVQPYETMQVWDGVSGARIRFDWEGYSQYQEPTIAYMTENSNLVKALLSRLRELGGVDMLDGVKVADISLGTKPEPTDPPALDLSLWPHLRLSNDQTLVARLLVGADGFNSPVRSFAQIPSRGWDYGRHGVVATLKLSSPLAGPVTAYQRFLPTGPIALLPLPGKFATLVWSTTVECAALLKKLRPADFVAMVNAGVRLSPVDLAYMHQQESGQADELSWRLPHTPVSAEGVEMPFEVVEVQEGSVASFPLRLRHADTYATHRIALAGDAAHTVHPLAGQGLNMGLGDVEALSRILESAVTHGQDLGDQLTLENYNAERYEVNNRLMGTVDKLHKLYSVASGPLIPLRSWGLETVDSIKPLKEFLMRQAAG